MAPESNPYQSPASIERPVASHAHRRRRSYYGTLAIGSAAIALVSQLFLPWPYQYRTLLTANEAFQTFGPTLVMATAIVMTIVFGAIGMFERLFRRRG